MSESEARELPDRLTYDDWARAVEDGRLLGQECGDCGHVTSTPSGACAHCGSRDLATVELPTTGEVYTVTTINVPPVQFEDLGRGYQVAIVELGDARATVRVEGEPAAIGDEVELTGYVDADEGRPGPLFEATD